MTEKSRLLTIVDYLTRHLRRPICSADLRSYFAERAEEGPRLLQAWGQVLLKASRPGRRGGARLCCVGRIGNRNYYSLSDTAEMREGLERERRRLRVKEVLSWKLSDHIPCLIGTEFEEEGRAAAAGFVREFEGWQELERERSLVAEWAKGEFVPIVPGDLIVRRKAVSILRAAAVAYHGSEERADRVHINKLLAPWRWPQSAVYSSVRWLMYSEKQVRLLAAYHFDGGDRARLACSRYLAASRARDGPAPSPRPEKAA